MVRRRGWLRRDGWWRKEGNWGFELKFTEETETKFDENDSSELELQDVVQHATHVKWDISRIAIFLDAIKSSKPSRMEQVIIHNYITGADAASLATAIESGCRQYLSRLEFVSDIDDADSNASDWENVGNLVLAEAMVSAVLPSLKTLILNNIGDQGALRLALAIRSGKLKDLAELGLRSNGIANESLNALADSFREGVPGLLPNLTSLDLSNNCFTEVGLSSLANSLRSGKLPNLRCLRTSGNDRRDKGVRCLALAIRSGKVKDLAELGLRKDGIGDESLIALVDSFRAGLLPSLSSLDLSNNRFTEVGLLSLAEALKSGRLNS